MVQIKAPSTPECQEGVPSQDGQHREEHRVVHHVQVEPLSVAMVSKVRVDLEGKNKG